MKKRGNIWKKTDDYVYKNFKFSLSYLKNIKNYIWFASLLFFCLALVGFMLPIFFQEQVLSLIRELVEQTKGLSGLELIRFIMINNMKSAFFAMIFGIFLGIIPFILCVVNGYVLGFVANKTVAVESFLILWRLLPHGILEIPAIMISIALGFKLGFSLIYNCILFYNKGISKFALYSLIALSILFFPVSLIIISVLTLQSRGLRKELFSNFENALKVFVFIVIPLLVIAAIVEGVLILLFE